MIGIPIAHVGGIPFEEALGSLGPALLLMARAVLRDGSWRRRGRVNPIRDTKRR